MEPRDRCAKSACEPTGGWQLWPVGATHCYHAGLAFGFAADMRESCVRAPQGLQSSRGKWVARTAVTAAMPGRAMTLQGTQEKRDQAEGLHQAVAVGIPGGAEQV